MSDRHGFHPCPLEKPYYLLYTWLMADFPIDIKKTDGGEQVRRAVLKRVNECFEALVGGSGHLACYYIDAATFTINRVEELGAGSCKYFFSCRAQYESEFTVYDEHTLPETHSVSGSIVLTGDFGFVYDEKGEVLLEPYKTLVRKPAERPPAVQREKGVLSRDDIDKLLGG